MCSATYCKHSYCAGLRNLSMFYMFYFLSLHSSFKIKFYTSFWPSHSESWEHNCVAIYAAHISHSHSGWWRGRDSWTSLHVYTLNRKNKTHSDSDFQNTQMQHWDSDFQNTQMQHSLSVVRVRLWLPAHPDATLRLWLPAHPDATLRLWPNASFQENSDHKYLCSHGAISNWKSIRFKSLTTWMQWLLWSS